MHQTMAPIPVTPIQLDVSTAGKLSLKKNKMCQEKVLMTRNDVWHKIKILHGAKYGKEYVLKSILNTIDPADLIPVRYQSSGIDDTYFIARNCYSALEQLCKNNLIIKVLNNDPIILNITLAFASVHDLQLSIQPLILASVTKRYDQEKRHLNLEKFHQDEELAKNVYVPLSQTKTLTHVLKQFGKISGILNNSTFSINIQNNDLTSLAAFETLNLTGLKSLDLRNNLLIDMATLTPLENQPIIEILLDGNPLCENYSNSQQYIESVRQYFPHLIKLDGIYIEEMDLPTIIPSYFPNKNSERLVRSFSHHFFTLHDQNDKSVLRGIYHKDAVYSLTVFTPKTTDTKNLQPYLNDNRNIHPNVDLDRATELLYHGPDEILQALKRLRFCVHDKNSFQYDVIFFDREKVVFTISGYLAFSSKSEIFFFNRTFVLIHQAADNEYQIFNDQYFISDNVPIDVTSNFSNYQIDIDHPADWLSPKEKQQLIVKLKNITTLNETTSKQYLENSNWNLKKAVINFKEEYKSSAIPPLAFT